MNHLKTILILGLTLGSILKIEAQKKHGLIVAIGEYSEETNWNPISSMNDVPLVKKSLNAQGFTNLIVITNQHATKIGILNAIDSLIAQVNPGDVVCIHFSSHGQQLEDFNGDEINDGLDEAIVPYDAPAFYKPGYKGEKHLLDDEIQIVLERLQTKLGEKGDVLVLLDACHSGTAARGGKARGDKAPLVSPDFIKNKEMAKETSLYEMKSSSAQAGKKAKLVVISASNANELNYEYKGNGSLTLGFSKAIEQIKPEETYRSLFSKIASEMNKIAPNQTPAIEGDIDRELFAGKSVVQEAFYNILFANSTTITLEGGHVNGLFKGTEIALYPAGTRSVKGLSPVATGKVFFADGTSAQATIDKELDKSIVNYWVFVTKKSFGDVKVALSLERIDSKKERKKIKSEIELLNLISIVEEEPDFYLVENANGFSLIRSNGEVEYKKGLSSADNWANLQSTISEYVQGQFIADLTLNDSRLSLKVELVPVIVENNKVVDTLSIESKSINGILEFGPKDYAVIRVTNTGSEDCYYTIIDIQPDGVINPVVPNPYKNEAPTTFFIKAGQSYVIPNKFLRFAPPYGKETYKVFMSTKPLNLAPIVMSKGAGTRGVISNQIEKLFQNSYSMSRGTPVETLDTDTGLGTLNIIFKIKSN